jgi:hypothetical protein
MSIGSAVTLLCYAVTVETGTLEDSIIESRASTVVAISLD